MNTQWAAKMEAEIASLRKRRAGLSKTQEELARKLVVYRLSRDGQLSQPLSLDPGDPTRKALEELPFVSPLKLSPARSGRFKITRRYVKHGKQVTLLDLKTSEYLNIPPMVAVCPEGLVIQSLRKEDERLHWTLASDTPFDITTQWLDFRHVRGDVLVGGLGIGMAPSYMLSMPQVKSITVVELEQDVIDLVGPHLDPRIKIVRADLFNYLASGTAHFDTAYIDIGYGIYGASWDHPIVPLRRLVQRHYGNKPVYCLLEKRIQSNVRSLMDLSIDMPASEQHQKKSFCETSQSISVFSKALDKRGIVDCSGRIVDRAEMGKLLELYVNEIGTPAWEAEFDWDSWVRPYTQEIVIASKSQQMPGVSKIS